MEGKLMNHIEFKFIRNAYPLHEKLFCYFQSPNGSQWQPEVGDWVGLYKVGWNSLKEHRVRKQIQNEWLETRRNTNVDYVHVVFEQHELPKDFEGLYQFVYVTRCDVVKGISPAFRFERVLPQQQQQQQQPHELRRMVESIEKIGQEINGQLPRSLEREPMGKIESDLIKECQRLNLNWGKITEETVNGKLMQKYLNNLRLIQKDEEVTKKIEELFVENGRLCSSLKTRIQEVQDLKKDCDDMKSINGDLLGKLALAERKVEQLEREKNLNMRKIEELAIKEQLPRVFGQLQGKHILHDLEETAKWLLQDDCEKVQPELKRGNSFYGELETPIDARVKLVQRIVEEPIQQQQQQQQQQQKLGSIEKIFREVDGTPSQVRLLKRVIEELKCDNELLRERVRQIDGERQPEIQVPVKTMTSTLIKDITGLCQLPTTELVVLHGEKQHHSLPTIGEQQPQSILSTITVPEQTGKSTVTITTTGRISGCVEEPKREQQREQRELRGQVGEYLNRLDEQIRNKIEERLRNKLQEQLQGKVEVLTFVEPQQQQQQKQQLKQQFLQQEQEQQRQQLYKVDEMIRQKIEQQQNKPRQPWSMQVNNEELMPSQKWRLQQQLEEQTRKLRDELTIGENTPIQTTTITTTTTVTKMCPVCGIVMPSELNVCDFEIHVNSHFTD